MTKLISMSRQLILLFSFLAMSLTALAAPKSSVVLEKIERAGEIRIGVKTDVAPFGFVSPTGEVIGFEIDMAEDLAKRLSVKLVMQSVTTENRFQKLELGEVDVLIATVGDSLERRKLATAIEPPYFQAGVTVMLRSNLQLKDWGAIRGKNVCALQGAYFNRPTAERHILNLQTYRTVRDALLALKDGHCDGFLYNRPTIEQLLKQPEFKGSSAPFPDVLITPWAIFVSRAEAGTELETLVGDVVADWYRNGFIKNASAKWDVRFGAGWPDEQLELWNRKQANGQYTCTRESSGRWPTECRRIEFVKSADSSGLQALGLKLKEMYKVDLSYVYDPYDRYHVVRGLAYTMMLTALSILGTLIFGLLSARVVEARVPVVSRLMFVIMSVGRFNPPILMMYLLFFGVGGLMLSEHGVKFSAVAVAVFCLAYYSAGIVMSAVLEAAHHKRKGDHAFTMTFASLGEAIEYARWPIKQALINVTKMSMISSAIAVPELLSATNLVMAEKGNLIVMMISLMVAYYLISSFWITAFNFVDHRLFKTTIPASGRAHGH